MEVIGTLIVLGVVGWFLWDHYGPQIRKFIKEFKENR